VRSIGVTTANINYADIISIYIALYQKRLAIENDEQQRLFGQTIAQVIGNQAVDAMLMVDNDLETKFRRNCQGFILDMIFHDEEIAQTFWQQIIEGADLFEEADLRKAAIEHPGSLGFHFTVMATMVSPEIKGNQITIRLPEIQSLLTQASKYAPN